MKMSPYVKFLLYFKCIITIIGYSIWAWDCYSIYYGGIVWYFLTFVIIFASDSHIYLMFICINGWVAS